MHANRPEVVRAVTAVALLAASLSVAAADGSNPCAGMKDDTARLACYDDLFAKPATATAAAPAAAAVAPAAAAVAPAAPGVASGQVAAPVVAPAPAAPSVEKQIEDFGLSPETAQAKKKVDKPAAPAPIESIESTIAGLQRRGTGELVLKLANGQVWLQGQADSRVHLKPGDRVTIKKALFGSYMLVSGYYSFKVRRVD